MPSNLNVSLIQSDLVWEKPVHNIDNFERLIRALTSHDFNILPSTDLIVLPELFSTGFTMNAKKHAETMDGKTVLWMMKTAREYNTAICGSLIIQEGTKYFNRFLFISPDGILGQYDKRHLFRMGAENESYTSGNKRIIIEYKGWRILPQICYDLRFPVWSRNQNDYDLMINVANWPAVRKQVWKTLLCARAIENQCYTIGLNRVGESNTGLQHSGNSMIIDFKGDIMESLDDNIENVITQELNLNKLTKFKKKFPAFLDADDFTLTS